MGARRTLVLKVHIYGVDGDADAGAVAQALGMPVNNPVGFDDLDGYNSDNLMFDTQEAKWES
jgi:hypothetical protein